MTISSQDWKNFINKLSKIDQTAGALMEYYIDTHGIDNPEIVNYAYSLTSKYGEAAGALAAEWYDQVAEASGKVLPAAEAAEVPEYKEVAKAVNGTKKTGNIKTVANSVGRLVKRTGVDTTMKNAIRDHAEWAWIPNGDTCVFCLTLASNGWQPASESQMHGGHAEHIHANCDCTFAVRFDKSTKYSGYDPAKYKQMYDEAEGFRSKDKINAMRRANYAENKDKINAQKRIAYANRKSVEKGYANIVDRIGTNNVDMNYIRSQEYRNKFDKLSNNPDLNKVLYDNAVKILDDNKGTDTETTMVLSNLDTIVNKRGEKDALGVSLSPGQIGMLKNKTNLVGLHNHPTNLPPNGSDLVAAGSRRYEFGVIATHDGKLYKYSAGDKPFLATTFDKTVDKYKGPEYNLSTQDAFIKALNDFRERNGIKWQLIE